MVALPVAAIYNLLRTGGEILCYDKHSKLRQGLSGAGRKEARRLSGMDQRLMALIRLRQELKKAGMWFACADMGGTSMYKLDLTGPMGLVIGNEGEGVSRLVREKCDYIASIPMKGDIDSLNASVACGVLAYEILRQRMIKERPLTAIRP